MKSYLRKQKRQQYRKEEESGSNNIENVQGYQRKQNRDCGKICAGEHSWRREYGGYYSRTGEGKRERQSIPGTGFEEHKETPSMG